MLYESSLSYFEKMKDGYNPVDASSKRLTPKHSYLILLIGTKYLKFDVTYDWNNKGLFGQYIGVRTQGKMFNMNNFITKD